MCRLCVTYMQQTSRSDLQSILRSDLLNVRAHTHTHTYTHRPQGHVIPNVFTRRPAWWHVRVQEAPRWCYFDSSGGQFITKRSKIHRPMEGVVDVPFVFPTGVVDGHISGPLHSHDLSSRPIILTRQAFSNGSYGLSVRAHWAEIEGKHLTSGGGAWGSRPAKKHIFFNRCQRPARRPARAPSQALASMKNNRGCPHENTYGQYMAIYGQIWTNIWPYF